MASSSIKEDTIITHSVEQDTHIVEHEQVQNVEKNNSNSSANASSQQQLLGFAKKFSLDAQFLPESKQAPLEDRAYRRKKLDELRQQRNMEEIMLRAAQYCSDATIKTMQNLWAKILAGEISHPGSYSLKTLQMFRTMSITEAKLLAKACSLAVSDCRKKNIRVISGGYQIPKLFNFFNRQRQQRLDLNQAGLSYADILTLADNHLVFEQEAESHALAKGEKIQFNYNGKPLSFTAKKNDAILTFYKFTPIGTELAHLVSDNIDDNYLTTMKTQLAENFIIEG